MVLLSSMKICKTNLTPSLVDQRVKCRIDIDLMQYVSSVKVMECRVDQPCRVEIQHGMAVPGELKTKMFT